MPLAIRLASSPAPFLFAVPGFTARRVTDAAFMAALQQRDVTSIAARFADGHQAWVAELDGEPAAWGWMATRSASIGELNFSFTLPDRARYLWNFVTLPWARGRGVYPQLLDAMVRAESADADVFWIIHAPENHASGFGMIKAGFTAVAELSFTHDGHPAVRSMMEGGGARAAALLGVAEVPEHLTRCWRCVRNAYKGARPCASGQCHCDYQKADSGCAAVSSV